MGDQNSVREVIRAVEQRIQYAESRREGFLRLHVTLFTAMIALLAIVMEGKFDSRPLTWGLGVGALVLAGVSMVSIWQFLVQTNFEYPFKKTTNTPGWFYRDAIKAESYAVPRLLLRAKLSAPKQETMQTALSESRQSFQQFLTNPDWTDQDHEQLFVLHSNEAFKNRFLSNLRTLTVWGFLGAVVAGIAAGVVGVVSDTDRPHSISTKQVDRCHNARERFGFNWGTPSVCTVLR